MFVLEPPIREDPPTANGGPEKFGGRPLDGLVTLLHEGVEILNSMALGELIAMRTRFNIVPSERGRTKCEMLSTRIIPSGHCTLIGPFAGSRPSSSTDQPSCVER